MDERSPHTPEQAIISGFRNYVEDMIPESARDETGYGTAGYGVVDEIQLTPVDAVLFSVQRDQSDGALPYHCVTLTKDGQNMYSVRIYGDNSIEEFVGDSIKSKDDSKPVARLTKVLRGFSATGKLLLQ